MSVAFTPGPWKVCEDTQSRVAVGEANSPELVAKMSYLTDVPRANANARLIASAPELYEAAKRVLANLNQRIDAAPDNAKPVFDGIADLRAALAKAEGRT